MFIKQIIEFELRGPGLPGRKCNPKTRYFYDKTKISKENLWVNYYLLLKILQKALSLLSFPRNKSITNLSRKCFKREL